MHEERDPAGRSERSEPDAAARSQTPHEPRERYGILEVERRAKDDRRALLLYTRLAQDAR